MGLGLLDKDDLNKILGKKGILYSSIVNKLVYASGIPEMDEILGGKSFTEVPCIVNLMSRKDGLEINMMYKFKRYYTGLNDDNILSIAIEDKEQVYEAKDKSVIGRALAGGLVLGPVGAIIGGMSGVGEKKKKVDMPELLVTVSYNNSENEIDHLIFSCKYKHRKVVSDFFKTTYPKAYNRNINIPNDKPNEIQDDPMDKIKKLAELKEDGILSEEEFKEKKKELLAKI